ncbi:MAG: exodeoxyribonuclease small subunit [Chloroflexota bacterium]|jgi:exodeoxyribonuclease VII small subunit|nr:exodeoxyribonuclease small subunit [Chloroflexota bacterium]
MADVTGIETLTYEEALKELESLIKRLETGSIDLADSIASYERGAALAHHCSQLLEQTEAKVARLVLDPSGKPAEVPMTETEGNGVDGPV